MQHRAMPKEPLGEVLKHIRKLAAVQTDRDLGDGELLERFACGNDEAAFTLLVERHGPMVHGVCNRILRNGHDADDACQAAFLVLARKAASIRKKTSLGSWLHGVACRVAADLRRDQARRSRRERCAGKSEAQNDNDAVAWHEVQTMLDEELQKLPEAYRGPLILCYLDGKTRDEAAEQLGASIGSLRGRLERGRNLLRKRLIGRGVTLPAALFAAMLANKTAHASLPPTLVISSAKAALAFARGDSLAEGLVAPKVVSLTQGVLKVMLLSKVKIVTASVACAGLLAILFGGALASTGVAQQKEERIGVYAATGVALPAGKKESDEEFIRRLSKDLRGRAPTPAEVHFFVNNQDKNRRQKLVDLFIQERQAKKKNARATRFTPLIAKGTILEVKLLHQHRFSDFYSIQREFYERILRNKGKDKELNQLSKKHLDRLIEYVKKHPKKKDAANAMLYISITYRALGKTVEADAWKSKLQKEHPQSDAAKSAQRWHRRELNELYLAPLLQKTWLSELPAKLIQDERTLHYRLKVEEDGIYDLKEHRVPVNTKPK